MDQRDFIVFDELTDGVEVLSGELTYRYFNEAARRQLGLAKTVGVGSDFRTLCENSGWHDLLQIAETCLREQITDREILSMPLADGSHHLLAFRLQPIARGLMITSSRMDPGSTSAKIKQEEQRLLALNERLEHLVRERTHTLRKALDLEIDDNALKSSFLSMTSHELQTPLASIRLSLEVLDRYNTGKHRAERERYHEHIRNEVENLLKMLTRIREKDQVPDRSDLLEPENLEVVPFMTEIVHELNLLTNPNQLIRTTHVGECSVLIDGSILRRILINLISNAIKYSGKDIALRTTVEEGQLIIMVKDQGIGIPAEEQPLVFSKNFRAKNTRNIPGTGLGLSIVHTYVQLLSGEIEFESTQGKGTTFWVSLPVEPPVKA